MITLTAPDNTPVEVDKTKISSMYANDGSGTYHKNAKTVLIIEGLHQAVKETMKEIDALKEKEVAL